MSKNLIIFAAIAILLLALVAFLKTGDAGTAFVWDLSNGGKLLLPLVLVSALIDSINPCAFSILLLTLAFLFIVLKLPPRLL